MSYLYELNKSKVYYCSVHDLCDDSTFVCDGMIVVGQLG